MQKLRIVTHNSKFHTDDIFAVATLSLILGEENIEIIRTRDPEIIKTGDYVVDVGGIYDFETKRFDHHQEGGAGKRENSIPYASFGLVWKHFGEKVCGSLEIANRIDALLVQPVDAGDNGIELVDLRITGVHPITIINFFESFNPTWKKDDLERVGEFMTAVDLAISYINRLINFYKDSAEAQYYVREMYEKTENKKLLVLDRYSPTGDTVRLLKDVQFVIYPRGDGNWSLKGVKEDEDTFVYRKLLPKSWAGKINGDLELETGVEGSMFCHNHLYTATAKTKEAILKMAEIALNTK